MQAWTSLHMRSKSGTKDVRCCQTGHKTNKTMKSGCDSDLQSRCKKAKTHHGSTLDTQGQAEDLKDRVAEKDASPGLNRSSEVSKAGSGHVDSPPSTAEDDNSELDLYRGEEELEQELQEKYQSKSEVSSVHRVSVGEIQSSISAPEDLQTYSEREWKGNTSKSRLIRKGYEKIASGFSLRIVRGDNYCALRATLFQVLRQSKQLPDWLQDPDIITWPKQVNSDGDLIKEWRFPLESKKNKVEELEHCLKLLQKRWQEAVQCESLQDREHLCQQVFKGHHEEYELLEALKFLMLRSAIQLHSDMLKGSDVPEFCWLLFARDSSKCPKSFLSNHLRHVGFSGGLEQVEMCLLGHSLQQLIKVYRLYKTDTEEFVTYYPNDHKEDWPSLCLLTEDDRHYNALVPKYQPDLVNMVDQDGINLQVDSHT